ncbi:LuxR C-terminal-related transcriptional regulator [Microbacterium sp. E-13]|uniref:LuxR C-terminal-related transcriptional regulator n=1 Tax=Microbacterium sp. E-13 TaxID=3404048 RepID=UPI003CFB9892
MEQNAHEASLALRLVDADTCVEADVARDLSELAHAPENKHALLLDNYDERSRPWLSELLLGHLHEDPALTLVVATRQRTSLEDPMVGLHFDTHVLDPGALLLSTEECGETLSRNGVGFSAEARGVLAARTFGWPAVVQLAATYLRLERMDLGSAEDATTLAESMVEAFTSAALQALPGPLMDDVKLMAVAPFFTPGIVDAVVGTSLVRSSDIVAELEGAGLVWPSSTRMHLAEPFRSKWMRDVRLTRRNEAALVGSAVARHLAEREEGLLALQVAVDSNDWDAALSILDEQAPFAWRTDPAAFSALLGRLRDSGHDSLLRSSRLYFLDDYTFAAPDAAERAAGVLLRMQDTKPVRPSAPLQDRARVRLLRAAGRFGLAAEASVALVDAAKSAGDTVPAAVRADAYIEAGLSHVQSGQEREAGVALGLASRAAKNEAQATQARGLHALMLLLEGHTSRGQSLLEEIGSQHDNAWIRSPWGEPARIAAALANLESDAPSFGIVGELRGRAVHPEYWPIAAGISARLHLLFGHPADAHAGLRDFNAQFGGVSASHYFSAYRLSARAEALIALRQAPRASQLFNGPFGPSDATAGAIALSLLFTGRDHEAYVFSLRWTSRNGLSPRSTLSCLIVQAVASLRLNNEAAARRALERAESVTQTTGTISPWSTVGPDDRSILFPLMSDDLRARVGARASLFAASVTVPRLTQREMVVLRRLQLRTTIADVASSLVVSPNTVKTQLRSVYRKLGVSDRAEAIRAAHAWGLLDGGDSPSIRAS